MSRRFRHGLVIGKFYPPHAGHDFLIATAAEQCDRVTVGVLARTEEGIPLADRVSWLSATHAHRGNVTIVGDIDDHPIDYHDDLVWDAHMAVFRAVLGRASAAASLPAEAAVVDAVFSSETYGNELARRLGATSVCVDGDRELHRVSGTSVRADVAGQWGHLAPSVRAGLARRVVVVGAESTGTTTLSRVLAAHFRSRGDVWASTRWVPEYGRRYTYEKLAAERALAAAVKAEPPTVDRLTWTAGDFLHVAERQNRMEDEAAAIGSPLLVCDTDSFATTVWRTRYLGGRDPALDRLAADRRPSLYLLTDDAGVPFVQDGIRDGESIRSWMTAEFADRLESSGRPWMRLTGSLSDRVACAVDACDQVLAGLTITDKPRCP